MEDKKRLVQALEYNFEISATIQKDRSQYVLYIRAQSTNRFVNLISPYIHPCFYYKIQALRAPQESKCKLGWPSAKSNHPKAGRRPDAVGVFPCGAHPRGHLLTTLINKMIIVFLSFLVSYIIPSINVDLHYVLVMFILELIVIFILFLIFVVNSIHKICLYKRLSKRFLNGSIVISIEMAADRGRF